MSIHLGHSAVSSALYHPSPLFHSFYIVYRFNIASRSGGGPPCGTRIVAGRIVKESYGAAKQQHTFTVSLNHKACIPFFFLLLFV